ncbi:MAG: 2-C-methyl-D-erythritol 4-phosphate cytidylyltransferase [Planctomycetales bacterium 12-60-4]|nr:MAG: 2-C-methyl-D-erythritol 4-phosphate cytidylyltransferase [Planctomycetales bacterium 12-60-4]
MPKFAVILPAAGQSSRYKGPGRKKVFAELQGRPVWVRSVEAFINRDDVIQTLIVVSPDDEEWFREKFQANLAFLDLTIVRGGAERADSVQNALARVKPEADYVAVHDAARPLIAKEWVSNVFAAAETTGAAILAHPVTSTLKRVGNDQQIQETIPRQHLWEAQTPQVARRDWLLDAFAKRGKLQPTDEAQLLEQAGYPVAVVSGSPLNLKITTGDDFRIAEKLLPLVPDDRRSGLFHPFADEDPRWP